MIRKLLVLFGHVIAVVFVFGAAITILGQMRPKPDRQEAVTQDPTVFVQHARYSPAQLTVFAQGEVTPKQQIRLTTQVGGKITDVSPSFADGGSIREGEVLVQIEDADYRLAVTRARARVASAEQALAVEQAESELARRDFQELSGSTGTDAPSDLTLRRPQLARAEADYDAAMADLRDAELALARTQIKAPFTGRVRSISANIGQFVSPGTSLGEIFSSDIAEIRLPMTDEDLAKLALPLAFSGEDGPLADLSAIAAGQERHWKGRVVRTDAAIDPSTRQIAAIVEVEDPYGAGADNGFPLAIGLFVDATVQGPKLDRAITLPRVALREGETVFTLTEDNALVETPVTVAAYTAGGVIVTGGIEEGERVVVSRVNAREGSKVRPLDPENPNANEPAALSQQTEAISTAGGGAGGNAGAN